MKKIFILFFLCIISFVSTNAQISTPNTKATVASPDSNVNCSFVSNEQSMDFPEIGYTNRSNNACAIQYRG